MATYRVISLKDRGDGIALYEVGVIVDAAPGEQVLGAAFSYVKLPRCVDPALFATSVEGASLGSMTLASSPSTRFRRRERVRRHHTDNAVIETTSAAHGTSTSPRPTMDRTLLYFDPWPELMPGNTVQTVVGARGDYRRMQAFIQHGKL